MSIDVARARRETPGCAHVLHFNNAGASLMPQPVLDALLNHLRLEARRGGYEGMDEREKAVQRPALSGCQPVLRRSIRTRPGASRCSP